MSNMYLWKDDIGFFLTNNYYDKLRYFRFVVGGNYLDDNGEVVCAKYCGLVHNLKAVCKKVLDNGGDANDVLMIMDDYEADFSMID